jgi:hypothetical protein
MNLYCFGRLMFRCNLLLMYDGDMIIFGRRIVAAQKVH